jgi:hypothetical protein
VTSKLAQTAITITDLVSDVATQAAKVGQTVGEVSAFLLGFKLLASAIPGLSTVVTVLEVAEPIIQKIAAAAPIVHRAIEQGDTLVSAAQEGGLLDSAKQLYALAVNADPARPETDLAPEEVPASVAVSYVGNLFERSFFTTQDPRFDRSNANMG